MNSSTATSKEQFYSRVNALLEPFEKELQEETSEQFPQIFIYGIPRSGTTLLYQLISHCFDIGYINNLAARFWLAPTIGITLSKDIIGHASGTKYDSHIGATQQVHEPHEFGFFWGNLLGYNITREYYLKTAEQVASLDWSKVHDTVHLMANTFGSAMVHKNLMYACHLSFFYKGFKKALFVHINRSLNENAISIAKAREARTGSKHNWWSIKPPNYEEMALTPFWEQIPAQMKYLNDIYSHEEKQAPDLNLLKINYDDICDSPGAVLENIKSRIDELGYELKMRNQPPEGFKKTNYQNDPDLDLIKKGIEKCF